MKDRLNLRALEIPLLATLCTFLWGSAYPMIKVGYRLLQIQNQDTFGKILFAGIRFFLAGLLLTAFASLRAKRIVLPKRKAVPLIGLLGLVQTGLQYFFFYIGLSHTTGSKSAILQGTAPLFAFVFSLILYKKERLTLKKTLGLALGFLGIILVNLTPGSGELAITMEGDGFVILAAVFFALGNTLTKKVLQVESGIVITGSQLMIGGGMLTALGICQGASFHIPDLRSLLAFSYLVLQAAVVYPIWTSLFKHNNVSTVSVYYFLVPVFGVLLSSLILGEQIAATNILLSLAFICMSIFLINVGQGNLTRKWEKT